MCRWRWMGDVFAVLDLFSGIGGFALGLERAGMRTVAFCETDPFCRRVLAHHWPGVPIHGDIRQFDGAEVIADAGQIDLVCGGFPCQDVSLAGRRAGLAGANSGLYRELVRTLRVVRPRHGIVENVAALLSDGMGTVLGDLAEGGFDAEWDCVPALAVGAPHERDRVWIVTHADDRHGNAAQAICAGWNAVGPCAAATAAHPSESSRQQVGTAGQPRVNGSVEPVDSDAEGERRGQGRRPADSFARIRDEARRNAADPHGARLAFREGVGRDAWQQRQTAQRDGDADGRQSIWPDEPALSRVDDGIPNWMDRVRATGNTVVPQIVEQIGRAIVSAEGG